jgi:hypothetical protein
MPSVSIREVRGVGEEGEVMEFSFRIIYGTRSSSNKFLTSAFLHSPLPLYHPPTHICESQEELIILLALQSLFRFLSLDENINIQSIGRLETNLSQMRKKRGEKRERGVAHGVESLSSVVDREDSKGKD